MNRRLAVSVALAALVCVSTTSAAPNFEETIARPLRYQPHGTDFIALDGKERFNRPLYGSGTAFRVDAGDQPEFSLFLPGRGGVLRLGLRRGDRTIWLTEAAEIDARYRPGSMLYTIRDPIIGDGELRLSVMASFVHEALLAKVELSGGAADLELIAAFGGATGERGNRNGDIGTERLPVREFFQLQPEHCKDNRIEIGETRFTLVAKPATLIGRSQPGMAWSTGDATMWNAPDELLASKPSETPVVVGRTKIEAGKPIHLRIDRRPNPSTQPGATQPAPLAESDFEADWAESDLLREQIASRLTIDTPDPFLNAVVAALNVAAEGTWDSNQTAIMHGAVAWRNKLLGWRGVYWPDALGLHDRFPQHVNDWFEKQNVDPIPPQIPPAEASANLSRNEDALHSNGNLTDNHYDMNLVAIDGLFRHLLWTGDLDYAKQVWPVIERHLAWERRMFRRDFGGQPLYEAYASIWASDDLWYNGGGTTHASAYNAYHNRMAARVAKLIGVDPSPYEEEAAAIEKAMRQHLWLADRGHYAEWKDLMGEGAVHPDAAAWTVYHTVDSQAATPLEAWQLARYAASSLPRLPIVGPNVPDGTFQVSTSDWFPYHWSTNNVVMAESAHTALSMFQANRDNDGFELLKGAILDSMYLGQCPGNVGMCTPLDMARGETQRDFADGCGALSRAVVEGLFGIAPDALEGVITLAPRFPADWNRASIRHASIDYSFAREGTTDTYVIHSRVPGATKIDLILSPPSDGAVSATVDGKELKTELIPDAVGKPQVRLRVGATQQAQTVRVQWSGKPIELSSRDFIAARGQDLRLKIDVDSIESFIDPQGVSAESTASRNGFLTLRPTGALGHRTVFANVKKGTMQWLWPIEIDLREPLEVIASPQQAAGSISFALRNNARNAVAREVDVVVGTHSAKARLDIKSREAVALTTPVNRPGTQRVRVQSGERVFSEGSVTNWHTPLSSDTKQESLDLTSHFNDRVTQIFRNEYLAPRSPFVSLAVPKQGIGSWCKPARQFEVDDTGLRALAAKGEGFIALDNGIRFATPSATELKNVLFVSQWSNYPKSAEVPLTGRASQAYLLMAGSTQSMQSRFDNGEVVVTYADGSTAVLTLRNPETWWPIDQDYAIDDFAFRYNGAVPPRIDLKTGTLRIRTLDEAKGKGRTIEGGAATVLDLPLDPAKELKSLSVRAVANEVVIGLMGVTLVRE